MNWKDLNLNRFGFKSNPDPVGVDPVIMSSSNSSKAGEKTANQVITGTVITDCIIKTSPFPARAEISENDINLYEDTTGGTSPVVGNTSTLNWRRSDDNTKAFTMVKRSSINHDLDNVWSFYATPPATGHYNIAFIGRDGDISNPFRNLGSLTEAVNIKTLESSSVFNGIYTIEVSRDGVTPPYPSLRIGDSRFMFGPGFTGVSSIISGYDGGLVGLVYETTPGIYMSSSSEVLLAVDLIPTTSNNINIGSPTNRIEELHVDIIGSPAHKSILYGTVIACPLPTVLNALEIIRKIPDPVKVGERGHFGDGFYFDDLTFPEEVLSEVNGKKEIEHTKILGLLIKAVKELELRLL